jgi:hypothetical protein
LPKKQLPTILINRLEPEYVAIVQLLRRTMNGIVTIEIKDGVLTRCKRSTEIDIPKTKKQLLQGD